MFYVIDFQITLSILLCRVGHYDVRNGHTSFISGGNNAITNVRIVIPDEVRDLFLGGAAPKSAVVRERWLMKVRTRLRSLDS